MSLEHTIKLVIKAQDDASKAVQKVENQVKKFSNSSKTSMNQSSQSTQKFHNELQKAGTQLEKVSDDYLKVGTNGKKSFNELTKSQQEAVIKFHKISDEAQATIIAARECGEAIGTIGKGWAINQFKNATIDTKTWAGSLDYAKTKLDLLGTNTDSLKGKIQLAGTTIQTYLGSKWDSITSKANTFKSKITALGSTIKSSLGNAMSNVSNRLQSLGQAFDGIGGMITQSLGVIGVNSIKEMTIEASISRDRIFNLSYALMGAGQSAEEFRENANSLWNKMDTGTNNSLVGLDQLSQAMSVIKLSTGATTDQLKELEPTILDIGQRAILMGKDGEEAVGLMQAAGKGLNGEFEMLKENLGISKDKLIDAGWSGAADDIDGYTKALSECLSQSGDVSDMMNTTYGKLTSLQKFWKLAGRSLGDEFLPYIDKALTSFINFADANKDGALDAGAKSWMKYAVGVGAVVSGFVSLAPTITPVFATFREAKDILKGTAIFLGIMEGEETALTLATVRESAAQKISAVTKWLNATATGAYSLAVGVLTGEITLVAAAQKIWNAVMAANPIGLVIVALAALALAVYEVGKYFGWWSDVGSMIDAISAGVNRLWAAFINNPDVQGFIKGLGDAWNSVTSALGPVITAVMNFFGVTHKSGEEFDIVRAIIDGVGAAFHQVANAVRTAIGVFQTIYGVFQGIASFLAPYGQMIYDFLKPIVCILLGCSPGIVPALEKVQEVFQTVWSFIAGFIGGYINTVVSIITIVITTIRSVINVFGLLLSGQISLGQAIPMIWGLISNAFSTILGTIINFVTTWGLTLINYALVTARGFVKNIVNWIKQLPGKVLGFLRKVGSNIVSQGANWVKNAKNKASAVVTGAVGFVKTLPGKVGTHITNTAHRISSGAQSWVTSAKNKASAVVTGVTSKISGLPGKVYNEFANIGKRMLSAGSTLVQKAKNIGKNIVNGLLDSMGIHSPGEIQEKVVAEFENTLDRVGSMTNNAYTTGGYFGSAIVDGFGDMNLAGLTGLDGITGTNFDVLANETQTLEVHVVHDNNYTFDGLPNTVSAKEVANMINNAAEDDGWIKKIVNNPRFQQFDLKEKTRIQNRRARSRGV